MEDAVQTTTFLGLPQDRALAMLRAAAVDRNLPCRNTDDGLVLSLAWGEIHASREREGIRLTLKAADRTRLHLLQEVVDRRLDEAKVAPDRRWSLTEPGSHPPNLAFATAQTCERLFPSYYRVRLAGRSLERFMHDGLHFRLLFPPAEHAGAWPVMSDTGRVEWPGGIGSWHRPVYTTRKFDADTSTLEFDVFVHEGGRVPDWCRSLEPGAEVAIMGPGGEWHPQADWLALFGDETALPAIARMLEVRPEHSLGQAVIMVSDKRDIQDLDRPMGVTVQWLIRGQDETLLEALARLDLPAQGRFVWFAGERSEVALAREHLLGRGLEKREIRTASYWSL